MGFRMPVIGSRILGGSNGITGGRIGGTGGNGGRTGGFTDGTGIDTCGGRAGSAGLLKTGYCGTGAYVYTSGGIYGATYGAGSVVTVGFGSAGNLAFSSAVTLGSSKFRVASGDAVTVGIGSLVMWRSLCEILAAPANSITTVKTEDHKIIRLRVMLTSQFC